MTSLSPQISSARLVVDTLEDLERCREIVKALGPRAFDAQYREVAEMYLSTTGRSRRRGETAFDPR
jgi:spore coat polysaccharide biosynthesis protein SpsF (cytidylyltransferase family)